MGKVIIREGQGQAQDPAPQTADTFTYTTQRGDELVVGRPRGVLKLKLRNILDRDELENDLELKRMASAVLSIRTINGEVPRCGNRLQFETIIQNSFKDDEDLDGFMNEYQRFLDPEYADFIESSLQEATEQGIVDPEKIKDFMTKKLLERNQADMDKVRLS